MKKLTYFEKQDREMKKELNVKVKNISKLIKEVNKKENSEKLVQLIKDFSEVNKDYDYFGDFKFGQYDNQFVDVIKNCKLSKKIAESLYVMLESIVFQITKYDFVTLIGNGGDKYTLRMMNIFSELTKVLFQNKVAFNKLVNRVKELKYAKSMLILKNVFDELGIKDKEISHGAKMPPINSCEEKMYVFSMNFMYVDGEPSKTGDLEKEVKKSYAKNKNFNKFSYEELGHVVFYILRICRKNDVPCHGKELEFVKSMFNAMHEKQGEQKWE